MGMSSGPEITQVDPNPASVQPLQRGLSDFLLGVTQGNNPFAGATSPLQRQSTGGIQQFLNQPPPETRILDALSPALTGLVDQSANGIGGFDQSNALVNAAEQTFQRGLDRTLGSLSNAAPGRFSTAFAGQGRDLASQALQDFNLFANQARQQGLSLDLQARQLAQSGILGGGSLLGQLAGQAGQAPFNRLLQAGQLGLQQTQGNINPTLQLLLGGLGFAQPRPLDTVVQQGGGGLGGLLGGLAGSFGGPLLGTLGENLGNSIFGGSGS